MTRGDSTVIALNDKLGSYMAECHAFSQELLFVLWWCRQDGFRQLFIIGSRFSRKTCNYFENLSKWVLSHITPK